MKKYTFTVTTESGPVKVSSLAGSLPLALQEIGYPLNSIKRVKIEGMRSEMATYLQFINSLNF